MLHAAYIDGTMGTGLVPCQVVNVFWTRPWGGAPALRVTVKVTAERGPYKRGQVLLNCSPSWVLPRDCVFSRRGSHGRHKHVRPYDWAARFGVQRAALAGKD